MSYRYHQGDRPLPGYTIQRGVGRGGFGEVYYATSDGGKEVAIKHLRENPQVELRGVQHVLNLKSPHLVGIHDIRETPDGEFFVIMEYVNGPSLRDLMNDAPNGLGPQKAAYFAREIAKGLAYLHDRGIVHRDVKPGNIFYEDGYVKIGDYGLSKFMAASQHSGQTVSVGTVHYMAPEVGSGNYDRTIDIYALGVMLYEMLLGRVPFGGSSMGEVLMKHLTAQPEVDELQPPFPDVIRKALAKDPKDRYQTVDELVSDLFSEEDLSKSVAAFEPQSLSARAARAADEMRVEAPAMRAFGTGSSNIGHPHAPPVVNAPPPPPPQAVPYAGVPQRLADRDAPFFYGSSKHIAAKLIQCILIAAGLSFAFTVITGHWNNAVPVFAVTILMTFAVYAAEWISRFRTEKHGNWWPRLLVAVIIAVPASGALRNAFPELHAIKPLGLALVIICVAWRGLLRNGRTGNRSLGLVYIAGVIGFALGIPFAIGDMHFGLAVIAATSALCVQSLGQLWPAEISEAEAKGKAPSSSSMQRSDERGFDANETMPAQGGRFGVGRFGERAGEAEAGTAVVERQRRSPAARLVWSMGAVLSLATMLFCFIYPNVARGVHGNEWNTMITAGVFLASAFLFFVWCAIPAYENGLWRGVFRKAIFFGGTGLCSSSATAMGLFHASNESYAVMVAGLILGGMAPFVVWFIPVAPFEPSTQTLDPETREASRLRRAQTIKVSGLLLLLSCLAVVVILRLSIPKQEWEDVIPVTCIPVALVGMGIFVVGKMGEIRGGPRAQKLELPFRRDIELPKASDVGPLLRRFGAMHNYQLAEEGHLFWTFRRGVWIGQIFKSDISKWRTQLNIAAFDNPDGGHTLRCLLDVDAQMNAPGRKQLKRLSDELDELERLVLNSSSRVGVERDGEVAV